MLPDAVHPPPLAHQFDSLEQQRDAATLGMWSFLITEILFFGGLFLTSYWNNDGSSTWTSQLIKFYPTNNPTRASSSPLTMVRAGNSTGVAAVIQTG